MFQGKKASKQKTHRNQRVPCSFMTKENKKGNKPQSFLRLVCLNTPLVTE